MPPQTNVYDVAPQAKQGKGLLGFLKSSPGSNRRGMGQSTVRAWGETGSTTRRAARRPVWE
jgi:hypothetical protein